jgi:hypothetical protein
MFIGSEWRFGVLGTASPSSTLWKAFAVENSSILGNPSLACPHLIGPLRLLSIQARASDGLIYLTNADCLKYPMFMWLQSAFPAR